MNRNPNRIKLILPSIEMKNRAMAFRGEFMANNELIYGSCGFHHYESFEDWLVDIKLTGSDLQPGRPPSTVYFAIRPVDDVIVGVVDIRHYLTEAQYHNGHIGYSIRPAERRKGYGTEMLRLALIKAEQLGVLETVVSCQKGNMASKRVILNNHLSFKQEYLEEDGTVVLVYTTD